MCANLCAKLCRGTAGLCCLVRVKLIPQKEISFPTLSGSLLDFLSAIASKVLIAVPR